MWQNFFKVSVACLVIIISIQGLASGQTQHPAEYLYDSVMVKIYDNYTADIIYKKRIQFNKSGADEFSILRVPVNRHIDFKLLNVSTKLPDGRVLELKSDDIETVSDFTPRFYPESKTKLIYLPSPRVGAVVDIAYRLRYNSLLYLPRFLRQSKIPTRNSYFQTESEIPYSYYISETLAIDFLADSTLIAIAPSIPPRVVENKMPPNDNFQVMIKPDSATYNDAKYGFSKWPDVAHFYNELANLDGDGTDNIPASVKALADSLVGQSPSRDDSLGSLLDFVVDNIRYISMDIGRGEFKPLAPLEVLNKKYGDCKDQSALLVSLCRAVGFDANPALMTTREHPDVIIPMPWPGFFNHVITAVDTGNGYLFLDASKPTCCFGNLPFDLRNRRALICGSSPFLEFTLTSPFHQGNDINIVLNYNINGGVDTRVDVDIEMFRDPAHVFHSASDEQMLSNVIYTFISEDILGRYRSSFRALENRRDYIRVTGNFYESIPRTMPGNRFLINVQSPFLKILKNYFTLPPRFNAYEFDYAFNINEKIHLSLSEEFQADKDSLVLAFNERGLKAELSVLANGGICEINKNFNLFDYSLSADRYNRFTDFLFIASQIGYNSIELIKNMDKPEGSGDRLQGP